MRLRIKGTGYAVADSLRREAGSTVYRLVREPQNRHDANAIAVHDERFRVGYVSAKRAALMAPLFDQMGAPAYIVSGSAASEQTITLWVDLPRADELRKFAKAHSR